MKTAFVIAHVLSLAFGVGGALILDIYLLRHMRGWIVRERDLAMVRFVSMAVKLGLMALWATGIAILVASPGGPLAVLANPKVQAKVCIVIVLTLNALVVEGTALPLLERQVGRPLFDGVGGALRRVVIGSAAVSSVSWCVPLALGLLREWNHVVPASTILLGYAALLALVALAANIVTARIYRPDIVAQQRAARAQASATRPNAEAADDGAEVVVYSDAIASPRAAQRLIEREFATSAAASAAPASAPPTSDTSLDQALANLRSLIGPPHAPTDAPERAQDEPAPPIVRARAG